MWCSNQSRSSGRPATGKPRDRRPAVATPPDSTADQGTKVPTCYRHPGRETYVSCVRCGRPACPDCLRSAAVGRGGRVGGGGGGAAPRRGGGGCGGRPAAGAVVTWALVGINVLLYLV